MYKEKLYTVKMTISILDNPGIPEETIYYRQKLPLDLLCSYKWYFEWLAALVKAAHPHRRVILEYFDTTCPCGQDFIDKMLPKRLAAKRKELAKWTRERQDDLFGFASSRAKEKAEKIRKEIALLENGTYTGPYVPPSYINSVRRWVGREKTTRTNQ